MSEKITYINSDGEILVFLDKPPFSLDTKEGFESVDTEIKSYKNFNQSGETLISKDLVVRNLSIEGAIIAHDLEDFYGLRKRMISALNPNVAGKVVYENVIGDFEIDVIPEIFSFIPNPWEMRTQNFRITWKALDPYFTDKSEIDSEIPMARVQPLMEFPLNITDNFEFARLIAGDVIEIQNNGDVATGAVFTINVNGPLVNPRLYNVRTQEFFALNGTFITGTKLRISTLRGKKKVEQNDGDGWYNIMTKRNVESTFLQIATGINYLQLQADSGVQYTTSYIKFEPKILGV